MAAFCACCGAEIGPKAEACPACGSPQHGMLPKGEKGRVVAGGEPGYPAVREEDDYSSGGQKSQRLACCWI